MRWGRCVLQRAIPPPLSVSLGDRVRAYRSSLRGRSRLAVWLGRVRWLALAGAMALLALPTPMKRIITRAWDERQTILSDEIYTSHDLLAARDLEMLPLALWLSLSAVLTALDRRGPRLAVALPLAAVLLLPATALLAMVTPGLAWVGFLAENQELWGYHALGAALVTFALVSLAASAVAARALWRARRGLATTSGRRSAGPDHLG